MMPGVNDHVAPRSRLRLGHLHVDPVSLPGALDTIERLVEQGHGGLVFTPNVDHVIIAERDPEFRMAYAEASLSLADGCPSSGRHACWATPTEKVSGSDLVLPLCERAATRGWRVYLLVPAPAWRRRRPGGCAATRPGVVGTDSPRIRIDGSPTTPRPPWSGYGGEARSRPAGFGAPKQEIWPPHRRRWAARWPWASAPASTSSPGRCGALPAGCPGWAWSGSSAWGRAAPAVAALPRRRPLVRRGGVADLAGAAPRPQGRVTTRSRAPLPARPAEENPPPRPLARGASPAARPLAQRLDALLVGLVEGHEVLGHPAQVLGSRSRFRAKAR